MDDISQYLHLSLRFTLSHRFHGRKHSERRVRLGPNDINWSHSRSQRIDILLENLLESCRLS